jgi:hypothetical protein
MEALGTVVSVLGLGATCIAAYISVASLRPRRRLANIYQELAPAIRWRRRPVQRASQDRRKVRAKHFPLLSNGLLVHHERRSRPDRRSR